MVAIARVRTAVEAVVWPGPGDGTDLKNLTAWQQLAEQTDGLEHHVSVRQVAELMGWARSTVEASNARLRAGGWLSLVTTGTGERSSTWLSDRTENFSRWGCDLGTEIFRAAAHGGFGRTGCFNVRWLQRSADPLSWAGWVSV